MEKKPSSRPALQVPSAAERARYDRPGHLDPAHAERLLALSGSSREGQGHAFVEPDNVDDDFAEELAETAVASMTSGEDALTEELDALVDEEQGGPFIETSGNVEYAGGTDESNTEDAMREPLPLTHGEEDDGSDESDD